MLKKFSARNKSYSLPIFFPDATLGVVRGLSSEQVIQAGIEGVVINTYHLMSRPGSDILTKVGGIKPFMNWSGLTASDSGGFQLFSLIHRNPKLGKIVDDGVVLYSSEKQRKKTLFTPENSIQVQFAINSDIMICLDDFSPIDASPTRLKQSIERTIDWARRCKVEFEKQCRAKKLTEKNRPLLLAVVQGHRDYQLRQQCAAALIEIDFDGYGFGGWPFDDDGNFDYEMARVTAEATPDDKLRFALGVGSPTNIVKLREMGYDLFDCVLPTRDARHQRLYVFNQDPTKLDLTEATDWYEFLYLDRGKYATDFSPVNQHCACPLCQHHSKAYLHHLFKIKDGLAYQLASIHNLYFYAQVMKNLK
ncbi:MAG: tRNA guanosine(34) transglycosylase Tgt [Candidatus Paceibacterota bacterium]